MPTQNRKNGFSLIEILVVIVIIGIVSSIALLSLGILGDDRELQTEARRFVSLIEVAKDEAMMQGREIGVEVMTGSYRFVELDPFTNQWGELLGDDMFRLRQLPADFEIELYLEERQILLDTDPAGFAKPGMDDNADLTADYSPHVFLFSSGDVTPFELHLVRYDTDQTVVLRSSLTGVLEVIQDDE